MKIGGLCFGYGGLDLAVADVLGAELAWYSEIDPGACKIAAHRFPGVPNVGDMTAVDWTQVEPVDVITGGTPCQDLSHAGKRGGMTEGTRSNLWVAMRDAIAAIRPQLVIWENVGGAASAPADSDLERRPGLLAGVRRRDGQPVLRALGRVVGDLSSLGYVGRVGALRAADVGAPHGRLRYFLAAHAKSEHGARPLAARDRRGRPETAAGNNGHAAPDAGRLRRRQGRAAGSGEEGSGRPLDHAAGRGLLPTPRATDGTKGGPNQRGTSGDLMLPSAVTLLPTPTANDYKGATTTRRQPGQHRGQLDAVCEGSLAIEAQRLLPTPMTVNRTSQKAKTGRPTSGPSRGGPSIGLEDVQNWGAYADAIARWEHLTRPAPPPTQPSRKGTPQLSPAFSEWLMGLPAGWVTDVPGITRNEALRAIGNGVCPQQAAAALRFLLAHLTTTEATA